MIKILNVTVMAPRFVLQGKAIARGYLQRV